MEASYLETISSGLGLAFGPGRVRCILRAWSMKVEVQIQRWKKKFNLGGTLILGLDHLDKLAHIEKM